MKGKAARERLTLIRLFEELGGLGYDGGYDADSTLRQALEQGTRAIDRSRLCPAEFCPRRSLPVRLEPRGRPAERGDGRRQGRPCPALPQQDAVRAGLSARDAGEMVFDAHDRAFALFKGACGRGIYDNMKTAVETIFVGKQRLYNRRFLQMCSHYLVDPVACTPASGWGEGQVENQVGLVREAVLHAASAIQEVSGRAERLAARQMHRLHQGASAIRS